MLFSDDFDTGQNISFSALSNYFKAKLGISFKLQSNWKTLVFEPYLARVIYL